MDCSPPGSSVHGNSPGKEWVSTCSGWLNDKKGSFFTVLEAGSLRGGISRVVSFWAISPWLADGHLHFPLPSSLCLHMSFSVAWSPLLIRTPGILDSSPPPWSHITVTTFITFWHRGVRPSTSESWEETAHTQQGYIINFCIFSFYVILRVTFHIQLSQGFPGDASDEEPTCKCRRRKRRKFDPLFGTSPSRRAWWSTPVFLPGKSHGQRSLVGCSL